MKPTPPEAEPRPKIGRPSDIAKAPGARPPSAPASIGLSHLKFRHLMLIRHLADHGALHQAARHLSISQPAATAMLGSLEALIGFRLFERSHRGVVPTERAGPVLERATTLLNEFDDFRKTLDRVGRDRRRVLRIGVVPQAFDTFLPAAIQHFHAIGDCMVRIQEASALQLVSLLASGRLDCVVGRLAIDRSAADEDTIERESTGLTFVRLYEEEVCIVAGRRARVSEAKQLTIRAFVDVDWVLQRPDSSVRIALNDAFLRNGLQPPEPAIETGTYNQCLALVGESTLFTVAPRRVAQMRARPGSVRIVELVSPIGSMQVGFIHRHSSREDGAVALLRDCLLKVVGEAAQGFNRRKSRARPARLPSTP